MQKTYTMKYVNFAIKLSLTLLFLILIGTTYEASAQTDADWVTETDTSTLYKVSFYDGHYFIGKILSQDEREIQMRVNGRGILFIPIYLVKSIEIVDVASLDDKGNKILSDGQVTQYILNTSAIPLKRGQVVAGVNTIGPDLSVGLTDHLKFRFTTTWVGLPMMGNLTYGVKLRKNFHAQIGLMGGWGSWGLPEEGIVLPYLGLTFGQERTHLTLSAGYGQYFGWNDVHNLPYGAISGSLKLSDKLDFIFDSYLTAYSYNVNWNSSNPSNTYMEYNGMGQIAVRVNYNNRDFLQFGGGAVTVAGEPLPFPLIQYFHKFN